MYIQKYFIWHKYKTLRGVKWIGGGGAIAVSVMLIKRR